LILPVGIKAEFLEPKAQIADAFLPLLEFLNRPIRSSILVPGLVGAQTSEQQTGSLARSETEFDSFMLVIGELRPNLEVLINEKLVKPLTDLNFDGQDERYASFKFKKLDDHQRRPSTVCISRD
jgi:phage gp29-like protein